MMARVIPSLLLLLAFNAAAQGNALPEMNSPRQSYVRNYTDINDSSDILLISSLDYDIIEGKNIIWSIESEIIPAKLNELSRVESFSEPVSLDMGKYIDKESSVFVAGPLEKGLIEKFRREYELKFGKIPQMELNAVKAHLNSNKTGVVAISTINKSLKYKTPFKLFAPKTTTPYPFVFNKKDNVISWGIGQYLKEPDKIEMAKQILIYDYRNTDDFILEIKTLSPDDRLILAKTHPMRTLGETIKEIQKRIKTSSATEIQPKENFRVPVIDFAFVNAQKLNTKNINENFQLLQMIRFKLDESGMVLRTMTVGVSAIPLRNFCFDKPFLVYISKKDSEIPYFAVWIDNIALLSPFK